MFPVNCDQATTIRGRALRTYFYFSLILFVLVTAYGLWHGLL